VKKILTAAALALIAGMTFAQAPGGPDSNYPGPRGMGNDHMGPVGGFMGIDWKIGTVVTGEYKKTTGTLTIGQTLAPTFTADGVAYTLWLPPIPELGSLKTGSTVTVEGIFVTIKSDKAVPPFAHAFKITVDGKEYDLGGFGRMHARLGPPPAQQ